MAQNTEKSEKTGFGMVNETAPGPVFCVFEPKIPRTFFFKLTEQSSRKKVAVGGFEPKKRPNTGTKNATCTELAELIVVTRQKPWYSFIRR